LPPSPALTPDGQLAADLVVMPCWIVAKRPAPGWSNSSRHSRVRHRVGRALPGTPRPPPRRCRPPRARAVGERAQPVRLAATARAAAVGGVGAAVAVERRAAGERRDRREQETRRRVTRRWYQACGGAGVRKRWLTLAR
jgi:hypothetical protein